MALNDDDITTSGVGGEGPADGGSNPQGHDGGADGGADSGAGGEGLHAQVPPVHRQTLGRDRQAARVPRCRRTGGAGGAGGAGGGGGGGGAGAPR